MPRSLGRCIVVAEVTVEARVHRGGESGIRGGKGKEWLDYGRCGGGDDGVDDEEVTRAHDEGEGEGKGRGEREDKERKKHGNNSVTVKRDRRNV